MDMAVDESWRDRGFREIDPRDVGRRIDAAADGTDAVAIDEHRARSQQRGAGPIDERAGRDEDRARIAQGEREV